MRLWKFTICLALVGATLTVAQPRRDKDEVTDPRQKAILETFKHQAQKIDQVQAKADEAIRAIDEVKQKSKITETELKKIESVARDIDGLKVELSDAIKTISAMRTLLPKSTEDQSKYDEAIKQVRERLSKLESVINVLHKSVEDKVESLPPVVRSRYLPTGSKWDCTFRDKFGEGKFQFVVMNRDGDNVSGSCTYEGKVAYTVSGTLKAGVWTFNQHFVPASGPGRIKRTFKLTSDGTKFTGSSPGIPSLSSAGDLELVPSK